MCVGNSVHHGHADLQKPEKAPLEQGLQLVESCLWVLGNEPGSSGRVVSAEPTLQLPVHVFLMHDGTLVCVQLCKGLWAATKGGHLLEPQHSSVLSMGEQIQCKQMETSQGQQPTKVQHDYTLNPAGGFYRCQNMPLAVAIGFCL